MVKKTVSSGRLTQVQFNMAKKEGSIGSKLDGHHHFIKLVGTWLQGTSASDQKLHILTFPVANCDFQQFLDDWEEFSVPKGILIHFQAVYNRLAALGIANTRQKHDTLLAISNRLKESMGCLTEAVI